MCRITGHSPRHRDRQRCATGIVIVHRRQKLPALCPSGSQSPTDLIVGPGTAVMPPDHLPLQPRGQPRAVGGPEAHPTGAATAINSATNRTQVRNDRMNPSQTVDF